MMEMKSVLARLLQTFDTQFAEGEDWIKIFTESKDRLVMEPGPLMLSLKRMQDSWSAEIYISQAKG
jgi:hypothetical protein